MGLMTAMETTSTFDRRVAFIGAGPMARAHVQAFSGLARVKVAGIHSRTRARAADLASEFGIPVVEDGIDALYTATRADLVVVSVPAEAALDVARVCFRYPWGVLLEKPPGCDRSEAEAIQEAATAAGSRVWVALNRRLYGSTRAVLTELAETPGPRFVHVQDQQSFEEARAWGYPERVVRNFMYCNSIHLVDYLTLFGRGAVVSVEPVEPWRPERPGVVLARIGFASGDLGLYEGIWNGPGPWACSVSTPSRRWEMRPLETLRRQNAGERTLRDVPPDPEDRAFKPGVRRQAMAVLHALNGGEAGALADLATAIETMRLVERIFSRSKPIRGAPS